MNAHSQRPLLRSWRAAGPGGAVGVFWVVGLAAEKSPSARQKPVKNEPAAERETVLPSPLGKRWVLADNKLHRDFPAMALDAKGAAWVAFIEHDGEADVLKLGRETWRGLKTVATLSEPGVIHQPAVAC